MEFLAYFPEVFSPLNFFYLLLGTAGGLLIGATPGLSPTMAVALLIPFTFRMEPAGGLILLGSTYASTVAGGAVSAILLRIPGAPANIATSLDGHPMASQGKAREALHYCFISSCIGGIGGMIVLVFFTPVLAEWTLGFGFTHLFWIAVLGITVIGSVGTRSILMGLLSGTVGLWLSTIGDDPILGAERFVFTEHLTGGIHIIPALIGLFALPQVLSLIERKKSGHSTAEKHAMEKRNVLTSLLYNIRRIKALTIGNLTGIVIGLIPGAGGQIAGLIAYDQIKKTSSKPESFGSGNPDGVIAVESANNAMVGPSLVPLLTLSVPGSPTAAVLLGGLLIHGIFPGPDLFKEHGNVVWTFIDAMIVGQLLLLFFGLMLSRLSEKVMSIPPHFMAAAITVLAVFGSYSVQQSFSDVIIMTFLGIGMYYLAKIDFSPAPLVLGLILGPIAEDNFNQGRMVAETQNGVFEYFFTGALNLTLIAICLVSVGYSIYGELAKKRSGE